MSEAAVVIFSRMGSRRLPGKALCDLGGKPLVARVLDRVALARRAAPIVLATTEETEDEPLIALARQVGVAVFRGARDDVLGRLIACCSAFGFDRVVRISGDSPFMPPELIDLCIGCHDASSVDIVTNVYPRSFPPGASVELITADALWRIAAAATEPADREHLSGYVYANPDAFEIKNFSAQRPNDDVRLTVDTAADLARARAVFARLGPFPERASLETVTALARAHDQRQRITAA